MAGRGEQYDAVQRDYQGKDGKELIDKLTLKEGCSVLDLGCGTGYLTSLLSDRVGQRGTVTGVDPDAARIAVARRNHGEAKNVTFLEGSSEDFPSGPYDLIFSNHVLQLIENKESAFRSVYSSLKRGGQFAFVCAAGLPPNVTSLLNPQVKQLLHFSGGDEYQKLARKFGFEIRLMTVGPNRFTFDSADQFLAYVTATIGRSDTLAGAEPVKRFREAFGADQKVHIDSTRAMFILEKT